MLSTERSDFETHLSILFGGYPTFLTPPRVEAYWRGLQKMPLSVFVRCVDQALGESGSDKLPTVNTLWQISRNLRTQSKAPPRPEAPADWYRGFGNHSLLKFLVSEAMLKAPAVTEEQIQSLVVRKNTLVEECRRANGQDEAQEWRDLLLDEFASTLLAAGSMGRL